MNVDAIAKLYGIILERKNGVGAENSYTRYLFDQGLDKILKKVGEECSETIIAAKNHDGSAPEPLIGEVSDLLFHLLVMIAELNVPLASIFSELELRAQKQGNLKQFKATDKNT